MMPTISMFYGIVIRMYWQDHVPPHFHAEYQGQSASFTLDGELYKGDFPKKQAALVKAWALIHAEDLQATWELAKTKQTPFRIDPLR